MKEFSPLLEDLCSEFCSCQVIIDPVKTGERCHKAVFFYVLFPKFLTICNIKLYEFKIVNVVFSPTKLNHVMRKITSSDKSRFSKIAE